MTQALLPGPASPRRGPLTGTYREATAARTDIAAWLENSHLRTTGTHRAATAARADLAAWLEAGRMRATGTHEQLWHHHAGYREAFA